MRRMPATMTVSSGAFWTATADCLAGETDSEPLSETRILDNQAAIDGDGLESVPAGWKGHTPTVMSFPADATNLPFGMKAKSFITSSHYLIVNR